MWTLPAAASAETADFVRGLAAHPDLFDAARPIALGRAPGRLDVMGGIADYSGALVLELPLGMAALAAAQWTAGAEARVRSLNAEEVHGDMDVAVPLTVLTAPYAEVRAHFAHAPERHWAAYVLGAVTVLAHERGVRLPGGVNLLLASTVPPGKGVSSSAAVEVAAMQAVCGLLGVTLAPRDLALLCQKVENLVVGAPCGVMDQMTSAGGQADHLLALLCQPAEPQGHIRLPEALEVWGIDSGIRHAVSGADYGSVRVGAFMGYRILAEAAGLAIQPAGPGRVRVEDPRWGGYLANVTPSAWEAEYRDRVPAQLTGAEFLARYAGFTDAITQIDPARVYAVRQPTAHPIYEHHRVQVFGAVLGKRPFPLADAELLGELMYQSHASYSACGLGSEGTDALTALVRAAGPARGVYGAKITGGGSGGTVAVLTRAGARAEVEAIAQAYTAATGRPARVLGGSSPGAAAFGAPTLAPAGQRG